MTFPTMVKFEGIYYRAGEEVPSEVIARDSSIPVEIKPEEKVEVEKPKAKKSNTKKTE